MVLITRSLDKIDPRVGPNGIKCATLPKQFAAPPQGDDDDDGKVTSTADYTVQDKTNLPLIVEMLEKYGIVIVKDLVSPPACDAIVGELEPHFFRDPSWNGSPFPKQTTVATRTVLKSKTAVEQILCHQLFSKVSAHFLSESNYFWISNKIRTGNSSIQLNSGITYKAGPNAANQMYHREDMVHHNIHEERDTFHYGDDTLVGLAVALTDTTKANGATRVIPKSHLYGPYRHPRDQDCNYIELQKGDCAFMLGSTYHAASANNTSESRISSFFFMTKSYLKPEENLFIDQTLDFFRDNYTPEALSLLGLNLSKPFCGHVDYGNPLNLLKSQEELGRSSLRLREDNYGETTVAVSASNDI